MSRRTLITIVVLVSVALIFTISMMKLTADYYLSVAAEDVLGEGFSRTAVELCAESAREERPFMPWEYSVHSQGFDLRDGHVVVLKFYDTEDPDEVLEEDTYMDPKPRKKRSEYIKCVFSAQPTLDELRKLNR